jgi:malonyl-CoA/methylmalonyl-CoA synthetase
METMTAPAPDLLTVLDDDRRAIALTDPGRSVSYPELARDVRELAAGLTDRQVGVGDRVVVLATNSIVAIELYFACMLIGAIWVGVNPNAPAAERDRQCRLVAPRLVVSIDRRVGAVHVDDLIMDAVPGQFVEWPPLDLPCAIAFTSGTTSTPKAVVHSRRAVSLSAAALAHNRTCSDDRVAVILPVSIHNVMVVAVVATLIAGAHAVLSTAMNARGVAEATSSYGCTLVSALVPATVYDMVHDDGICAGALATLRYAGTGAAGLSEELRSAFEAKFAVHLRGSYGMTEAMGPVALEDPKARHRPGSSGVALPHVRIDVEDGQLVLSAAAVGPFAGMFAPPMGTWTDRGLQRTPTDGPLRTGDHGCVGADGSVFVTGRGESVIVRGGTSVEVGELETVLSCVRGVREIAITGQPDTRLGQRIVAFVELEDGAEPDVETRLRDDARAVLSHGKVPDRFIVVDSLPRNAMGKVERPRLVELLPRAL